MTQNGWRYILTMFLKSVTKTNLDNPTIAQLITRNQVESISDIAWGG